MVLLENNFLKVELSSHGAELHSIQSKKTGIEYLWQGGPAFWAGRSPLLFPIVGKLAGNEYTSNNRKYKMRGHGFARDSEFAIGPHSEQSAFFVLQDTPETLQQYPYSFRLEVRYDLQDTAIRTKYIVENTGTSQMPFSIGAHPGFRCPLHPGEKYEDYYLKFNRNENLNRLFLNSGGLLEERSEALPLQGLRLPLNENLFNHDALVFDRFYSDQITLKSSKSHQSVQVSFPGFTHLGLWAAPGAPFVCIEPWFGINDKAGFQGTIFEKDGILVIGTGEVFQCEYFIQIQEEEQ